MGSVSNSSFASIISSSYHNSISSVYHTNLIGQKNKNVSNLEFKITDRIKDLIMDRIDHNKSNAAMVIGLIDPNGTQFYGYGKLSNISNADIYENTVFLIGSTTKVFTTILLADMVNKGIIKLDDPIEKYLPPNVSVPQYNGHKITIEHLSTHTSGLPEFPDNFCPSFDLEKNAVRDSVQYRTNLFN